MSATDSNPLDLATPVEPSESRNTKPQDKVNTMSLYLIGGALVLILIIVVIIWVRKRSSTIQAKELKDEPTDDESDEDNGKLRSLTNENLALKQQLNDLQITNQNYAQHINRLAEELERKGSQQLMPMTENSYEAPDPNSVPEKPQVIKDKDAIKQMVNSRRATVQDEIDNHNSAKQNEDEANDADIEQQIKQATAIEDSTDDETNNDDKEDKDVESLMNIIQAQN